MRYIRLPSSQVPYLEQRQALLKDLTAAAAAMVRSARLPGLEQFMSILDGNLALRVPHGDNADVFFVGNWDGRPTASGPVLVSVVKWLDAYNLHPDNNARPFALPGLQTSMLGAYYAETRTIYFAADSGLNLDWMTLAFVHELSHAVDDMYREGADGWQSEWRARSTAYRGMQLMAGPQFRAGLRELTDLQEMLLKRLKTGDRLGLYSPDSAQLSDAHLDALWRRPVASNADERQARRTFTGHALLQETLVEADMDGLREFAVTK